MGDSEINFIIFSIICVSLLIGLAIYSIAITEANKNSYCTYIVQHAELIFIFNEINIKKYNISSYELNNLKIKANFITNQICNNYLNQKDEIRIKDTTDLNNKIQNM